MGALTTERAALNKIYRAVHDGVCPKCGHDIASHDVYIRCDKCLFTITREEFNDLRHVVAVWGEEAVKVFERWRLNRVARRHNG